MKLPQSQISEFRKQVYNYYLEHKRPMPWRNNLDPYAILVSEIMLQQTQVPRVITKFEEFDSILYLYSINEKSYYYNNKKMDVPKNVLNKWFDGSLEVFYKEVKNLIRGIDADDLRSKLIDIVNFYNNDYVSWVNVVYERFRYIRDLV
jgi:endonuclease III-like uncharacterized protein